MLHTDAEKPEITTNVIMTAKEQEEYKAKIMACSFVKMHLGITVGLEGICYFKISGTETYIVKGIITGNDKALYWSVTLRFNGSDWNNINNWAELAFKVDQSSYGG